MAATVDTTAPTASNKIISPLQQGLVFMKDKDVLDTTKKSLESLAGLVQADLSKGFDAIHANIPWNKVSVDYLKSLPVSDLVTGNGDTAGLFFWVDSLYMDKAVDVLRAWGFEFKSVLHVVAFDRPPVIESAAPETAADMETTTAEADAAIPDSEAEEPAAGATTTEPAGGAPRRVSRKQAVPPGWSTEGLVPSRTRQLWYAEKTSLSPTNEPVATSSRFLKDASFIRKRLAQVSTFYYPESDDPIVTTLSAKKKNIEHWKIFSDYDVYMPIAMRSTLEQIFKPTARVLSLFASGLSRNWFTWGPNVPGYFCGPLRNDSGFALPTVLLKSLSNIKNATVQRHLTLINQYAVNLGKQLGSPETEDNGQLIDAKLGDFIDELCAKAESGGGVRENPLSAAAKVHLLSAESFRALDPIVKTQFVLMIAQVIRAVFQKNAEAADRRKRSTGKRKHAAVEGGDETTTAPPAQRRKHGIAAPVWISDELAAFMGLESGTKVARTDVVKFINEYIKRNNLQNPAKRNHILLNDELQKLMRPDENFGPVTFFNQCRLLKKHFVAPPDEAMAVAA